MSESQSLLKFELSKLCSALQSDEKRKRKNALDELKKELWTELKEFTTEEKFLLVYKAVFRCFSDKAEAMREAAVGFVTEALKATELDANDANQCLVYLIPILCQRFGTTEIVREPSEEVRLLIVALLRVVVEKYNAQLNAFLEDIVKILAAGLVDPYPKVRLESCYCISEISKTVPRQFYHHSDTLVAPILISIKHQHSKVRSTIVDTLSDMLRYGNSKKVGEVTGSLGERLFDQSPVVRLSVIRLAGSWLIHLPDRYSFFPQILPIMLTGMVDDLPQIREEAQVLWEKAGTQWALENEKDLKDEADFLLTPPTHYPTDTCRPNLGCRTLLSRHFSRILAPLLRELFDWLPEVRLKSAQLLSIMTLNNEAQVTHHMEKMLVAMFKAATDEVAGVVEHINLTARYLGYFVPCSTVCQLALPMLESQEVTIGHLRVTANILSCLPRDMLAERRVDVAKVLCRKEICRSSNQLYQCELLECCRTLVSSDATHQLFNILVTTLGLANTEKISHDCETLLDLLSETNSLTSVQLYAQELPHILPDIISTSSTWTLHTHERLIFTAICLRSAAALEPHLTDVLDTLAAHVVDAKEPEMCVKALACLNQLVIDGRLDGRMEEAFEKCLAPGLVWRAGRTAEAVRLATVSCLYNALRRGGEVKASTLDGMMPVLVTLAEDAAKKTRWNSLRVIELCLKRKPFKHDVRVLVYPVVLKRLDDSSNEVRLAAVEILAVLFDSETAEPHNKPHWDLVMNTMLVHLDDPDFGFRDAVLAALKRIGRPNPEMLLEKVVAIKQNFRNVKGCQELEESLERK